MAKREKDFLIFIDTNIYLDFYRSQNNIELSLLYELLKIKDMIITTDQVKMEFKKNRQRVIMKSLSEIPTPNNISFPAFASKIKGVKKTNRINKELKARVGKFKDYLTKVMLEPKRYDKVYQACQEIFEHRSNLNLKRPDKKRYEIRHLAKKRFILGYPPRKNEDITIGDAINWEWIIACCNRERKDVVIISRDSDYGINFDNKNFLNDWLNEEFKSRISPRRKAILTNKLSEGLKKLSIPVSKEAENAETDLSERVNVFKTTEDIYSVPFLSAVTAGGLVITTASAFSSPYFGSNRCSICGKSYAMTVSDYILPPGTAGVCNKCRSASK